MMNLLPQSNKSQVREEYLWRFVETACIVGIVVTLLATLLLLPSFMYVTFGTSAAKAALASAENERALLEKDTETRAVLRAVQAKLALLKGDAVPPPDVFPLIEALVARRTEGIRLKAISLERTASLPEARGRISIGGEADDRSRLLRFVASLEADERFSRVDSPLQNLVPKKQIPFTIQLYVR